MAVFPIFIAAAWLVFIAYWLISAIGVKRNIRRQFWRGAPFRAIVFIVLVLLLQLSDVRKFIGAYPHNVVLNSIGGVLCTAGIAFAIWARIHLGRNWGMPMSLKEGVELITSGPYQYVRHPIYSGVLLALLGSAMVDGLLWIVIFAVAGVYFLYSARVEERLMMNQFPSQYGQYKQRTKMLIPGIY